MSGEDTEDHRQVWVVLFHGLLHPQLIPIYLKGYVVLLGEAQQVHDLLYASHDLAPGSGPESSSMLLRLA